LRRPAVSSMPGHPAVVLAVGSFSGLSFRCADG
jgi:hypothetical protein